MTSSVIYLDNHATTPLDPRVLDAMLPWMTSSFGNAHSRDHVLGQQAAHAVESAREDIVDLVGANADNVIFTSGATESTNIAIEGFCLRMQRLGRRTRIALPQSEHAAVIETCQEMERRGIAELRWIRIDQFGRIYMEDVEAICRSGIDLVCVMGANNEIGNIYPVDEIGVIASGHGAAFFCDGSQSIGKVPIDFDKSQVDFLTVSAHKIYGPKGVGALIVREANSIVPTRFGGAQERGLRPGTLNVPGIVGLGIACRLRKIEMEIDEAVVRGKRDQLQVILSQRLPSMRVNGDPISRLAGNLHIAVTEVPNDAVMALLRNRLAISTGAACSSGAESPSHVLRAIGFEEEWINGALRIGIGKFNDERDVREGADILCEAIEQIRKM